MTEAEGEEAKPGAGACQEHREPEPPRDHPDAEPQAEREERLGGQELEVPRPSCAIREQREQVERIAQHGEPLPQKRDAAGAIAVPERPFAVRKQGAMLQG